MTPAQEMVAARAEGRAAADGGQLASVNPYAGDGDDPRQRVLATQWLRGYQTVTGDFPVATSP